MNTYETLSHTTWECKYHIIFIPKYRRKSLYGAIRKELGAILHELARQRESRIEEGHMMPDHVHMLISIPPKYAVSQVIGYIKGKSAIQIARRILRQGRNFTGQHFWARGYFVSTVGRDEAMIRAYIQNQEKVDHDFDRQFNLNLAV
jgi:putative transposase